MEGAVDCEVSKLIAVIATLVRAVSLLMSGGKDLTEGTSVSGTEGEKVSKGVTVVTLNRDHGWVMHGGGERVRSGAHMGCGMMTFGWSCLTEIESSGGHTSPRSIEKVAGTNLNSC